MCNYRGLVLIFLILLFICLVVFLFPQRDCNFLHFLTDTSAPHRPAELLCSKPQKCRFTTLWYWSCICCLPWVSLLCAQEDLRRGFKLTIFRDGPESKDCKTMKALAFCGAYEKLCTTLVTSRERGCWTTKTASSNSLWNEIEVNWWKEEWGLCWVCSSPVLVIDLSMIVSKTTVSLVLAASLGVKQQIAII